MIDVHDGPPDQSLADTALPLDMLLVNATRGPLRRLRPDSSVIRWGAALARDPATTAARLVALAAEITRIVGGTSSITPARRDRRFTDDAWATNPMLCRLLQVYLACGETAKQLLDDAELEHPDRQRLSLLVENVHELLAPSNVPLLNPLSAKAAIDTGGLSLLRGAGNLVRDLASAPRIPEMVDPDGFIIGANIAATPGSVVFRSDHLEVIQYRPQTAQVHVVPLLIVPPTINKYYVIDLAPTRSLVEYATELGFQVFVISWRNPDVRHADWGFETYVQAVLHSHDAIRAITGSHRVSMLGLCSGGLLASIAAARLAGTGHQDELAALLLAVTVIDNSAAGTASALLDPRAAKAAKELARRKGYLDGAALAEVFAWLRPGDLIWNYWVNNYLLGRKPPSFDILFWNTDTVRMTARLHADFIDMALDNALTRPDALTVLGTPVDLSRITVDAYVAAGSTDHITPWENCYKTTRLLGGTTRFVLSNGGHVAALVNPPGNAKAGFRARPDDDSPASPAEWLERAVEHTGSWWTDAMNWLEDRSGEMKPAPEGLGSADFPPLATAPGTYIFDK